MDTRLAKRNYSIQQWKTIIQDRNNTNLTVDEYCKQNDFSRNSYFYWLQIIREEVLEQSSESGFVELSLMMLQEDLLTVLENLEVFQKNYFMITCRRFLIQM